MPPGDAGAAGDEPMESAGSGGAQGGAANEAGAAGTPEAGAAGSAGADNGELTLATLAGDWSGTIQNTYVCESTPSKLAFAIEGSTVTLDSSPYGLDASGTIEQRAGSAFALTLAIPATEFSPGGTVRGQLFVDASANYALLVLQELDEVTDDRAYGSVALLQRGGGAASTFAASDLVGTWAGTGVHLDAQLGVVDTFTSSGTFNENDGLLFTGLDGDGQIGGEVFQSNDTEGALVGVWAGGNLIQSDLPYGGVFLMSDDKQVLAAALLKGVSENNGPLCDLYTFQDMSVHRFGIWTKLE